MRLLITIACAATVGLGCLQYDWVGRLGESELRARREALEFKLQEVALMFDHQLLALHRAFCSEMRIGAPAIPSEWSAAFGRASEEVGLVGSVRSGFWMTRKPMGAAVRSEPTVWKVDFASGELEASTSGELPVWAPKVLEAWSGDTTFHTLVDAIGASPGLVIPILDDVREAADKTSYRWDGTDEVSLLIVPFALGALTAELREQLVKQFGPVESQDYAFAVAKGVEAARWTDGSRVGLLEGDSDGSVDLGRFLWSRWQMADLSSGIPGEIVLFDLGRRTGRRGVRVVQQQRQALPLTGGPSLIRAIYPKSTAKLEADVDAAKSEIAKPLSNASWRLHAHHRAGSLEVAADRLRVRNLLLGFAVLVLLLVALTLAATSAARSRQLAAQQQAFAAGVSHELRTPLSVVVSAGENLADGVVQSPEDVRRYGELIVDRARQLSALTERVLAVGGVGPVDVVALDLVPVIDRAIGNSEDAVRACDGSIAFDRPVAPLFVRGEPVSLQAAVENILQNALKHGGSRPQVEVSLAVMGDVEAPSVTISITDSGPGIPADELGRVFEPFFRGRNAVDIPGSGLGLSIARQFITSQGGAIGARSAGRGGVAVEISLMSGEERER